MRESAKVAMSGAVKRALSRAPPHRVGVDHTCTVRTCAWKMVASTVRPVARFGLPVFFQMAMAFSIRGMASSCFP